MKSSIASLPPGLSYADAARRIKKPYQWTRLALKEIGYLAADGRATSQRKRRIIDPNKIDWTKSNIQIARDLLVSRQRVSVVRRMNGFPRVESRGRKRKDQNASCIL